MRQYLPESAGYPLHVAETGQLVQPDGTEFDAPYLVPGCVSAESPDSGPLPGESGTPSPGMAEAATSPPAAEGIPGEPDPADVGAPASPDSDQADGETGGKAAARKPRGGKETSR